MNTAKHSAIVGAMILPVVAAAIAVGVVAWLRIDSSGQQGNRLPETFDYDLEKYAKIDPALIRYTQTELIPSGLIEPRAVAVGPGDQIFVAGDKAVVVFAADGKQLKTIELKSEPHCLAVKGTEEVFADDLRRKGKNVSEKLLRPPPSSDGKGLPGTLYLGMRDHVEVCGGDGRRQSAWPAPSPRAVLTSIAVGEEDVFVADAGSLVVWHYDRNGKLLGQIGKRDSSRDFPGFVVPSPYFDVAIAPDGLLRVVNPGMHLIQAFTFDGQLDRSWGKRGLGIESFCGCCNPSNIAILSDGRIVTAEKGLPRVKVYSDDGKFECVVVGTSTLAPNPSMLTEGCDAGSLHPVDLAVDSRDRILVLDPSIASVRVFVRRTDTNKEKEKER
jgi:hypothetical protein